MIFQSPGEVCFYITDKFPIYWYGLIMAFACFAGVYLSYRIYKYFNYDENADKIWDFATLILIFGIIGARLYYCLLNFVFLF